MSETIQIHLTSEEAHDLMSYFEESDYPKNDNVQDIQDQLNYELEDVEPLDFDDSNEYKDGNVIGIR